MKISFHIDLAMSTFLSHKVARTSAKRGKVAFLHNQRLSQNELVFLKFGSPEKFKVCSCDQDDHFASPLMQGLPCGTTGMIRAVLHNTYARGYVQVRPLF